MSLALLVTACGAGKSDSVAEDGAKSEASTSAEPNAKALSTDELEKAVLADGDVEGYKVTKPGPADITEKATANRAECTPLAEVSSGLAQGEPVATVQRKVLQEPAKKPSEGVVTGSDEDKKLSDMTEDELDKALQEFEDSFTSALSMTATLDSLDTYDARERGRP
ncbi:hypothetical protein [Streptomyces sp. PKU-EA00015]|uniref:hypothetical protein n=1 Tax=Streptomyces sp. PKU-EA00015 TaxID=2748326 RepID=UPI00210D6BD1|nr:hypothetical protein [Streptomyces sp. PKU-EA00015]